MEMKQGQYIDLPVGWDIAPHKMKRLFAHVFDGQWASADIENANKRVSEECDNFTIVHTLIGSRDNYVLIYAHTEELDFEELC